jgi:hypothetical protein
MDKEDAVANVANETVTLHIRFRTSLIERMKKDMTRGSIAHLPEYIRGVLIMHLDNQEAENV